MPFFQALIDLPAIPLPWTRGDTRIERSHIGAWRLVVETDRFTGRLTCQLQRGGIAYERQALVFHLSSRVDTTNAAYRIDGGPTVWSRTDAMELAGLGFALYNDDLANPSGGLVRVPMRRVMGAHAISIQPKANASAIKFNIQGFDLAMKAADKAGCTAEEFR
jgi:hypothetical protein